MKIDKVMFDEIFDKRENHWIFIELEKDNPTEKKWYIKNEDETIEGPFNTFEMDKFFLEQKLQKKSKIK